MRDKIFPILSYENVKMPDGTLQGWTISPVYVNAYRMIYHDRFFDAFRHWFKLLFRTISFDLKEIWLKISN